MDVTIRQQLCTVLLPWRSESVSAKNGVVPVATSNLKLFNYIFVNTFRILGLMSHVTKPLSRGWKPSSQSSVWFLFRSCFSALRPKINYFRIHKKCYFPVKVVVSLNIFVRDCRLNTVYHQLKLPNKKESRLKNEPSPLNQLLLQCRTGIYSTSLEGIQSCILTLEEAFIIHKPIDFNIGVIHVVRTH